MVFSNRCLVNNISSRLVNCEFFAENYGFNIPDDPDDPTKSKDPTPNSCFLSIWFSPPASKHESDNSNTAILRDCVFRNIGLTGTVMTKNCNFFFGPNVNFNYEAIHADDHSRIINCRFDGRAQVQDQLGLKDDVIDLFNGHDIIIAGCSFLNYRGYEKPDATPEQKNQGKAGINMITVKSHYRSDNDNLDYTSQMSNIRGPQNGVIVRNCYFYLPEFNGSALEVWNKPAELENEENFYNRDYNRNFTIIENNYFHLPVGTAFINCLKIADYMIVRNNMGCVKSSMVETKWIVPKKENAEATGQEPVNNRNLGIIVQGNILRYQRNADKVPGQKMAILKGTNLENTVISNNIVEGVLWKLRNDKDLVVLPMGTIRINDNQTVNNTLYQFEYPRYEIIPDSVLAFISGNVAAGKKTDIGPTLPVFPPMEIINDLPEKYNNYTDFLLYEGMTFYNISDKQLYIILDDIKTQEPYIWFYLKFQETFPPIIPQ